MEILTFLAEQEDKGKRIDVFLAEQTEISRSRIQKLTEKELLQVNDKNIKSNYKLRENDFIKLTVPDAEPVEILP